MIVFDQRAVDDAGVGTAARDVEDHAGICGCQNTDQPDPQLQNG